MSQLTRVKVSWAAMKRQASTSPCCKSTRRKFEIILRSSSSWSCTSNACRTSSKTRRSSSRRRSRAKRRSKANESSSSSVTKTCWAFARRRSPNSRQNRSRCAWMTRAWRSVSIHWSRRRQNYSKSSGVSAHSRCSQDRSTRWWRTCRMRSWQRDR